MTSAWSTARWCGLAWVPHGGAGLPRHAGALPCCGAGWSPECTPPDHACPTLGGATRGAAVAGAGRCCGRPRLLSGAPRSGGVRRQAAVVAVAASLLAAALVAAVHWLLIYGISVFPASCQRDARLVRSRRRRPAVVADAPVRLWGRGRSRTTPWRSTAAATAAFLAVLALSAVQINIYFGLNHTVGDLTGTAVARIPPLEAGLTRAAGGPAATGLAQWNAPGRPSRRRHPQGRHPRHDLRLPEPGRLHLPPAGLPGFAPARAAGAGPLFRPAGRPRRLADRRRTPEPAGPVRRGARRRGTRGGGGRSQRLAVGQHAVHGQPDCPGGHLPGPGRAGLDQPHARRRPGSAAVGRGRLLLRRHLRHADGDPASRRLQRGAGVLQREGAGPREGAREDHRGLLRRRHRGLRPADPAAPHGGKPLRRPRRVLRRRGPRPGVHRLHGRALRRGTAGRVHASRHTGSPTRGTPGTRRPAACPAAWTSWPGAGGSRHEPGHDRQPRTAAAGPEGPSVAGRLAARACAGRWRTSVPYPSRWRSSRPSSSSGPSPAASCPGRRTPCCPSPPSAPRG